MDPSSPGSPPPASASPVGRIAALIEEVPVRSFVKFLKISARRAFRLRIETDEVLPAERYELEHANPPIIDRSLQAFLAWRRSVLFMVSCSLVALTVIGVINALGSLHGLPQPIRVVKPVVAEGLFCMLCWIQLRRWAHWRQQRRWLFWGWLVFMLTPFVVFIYPLRTIFEDLPTTRAGLLAKKEMLAAMGVDGVKKRILTPFVFAMLAMLQLAPKAISLMPGLVRASMVIKLQFPGSSAPGWLIVMAAPMYALLAYVILIVPYQFTGSGYFIGGILFVVTGQIMLARAGFQLARPLTEAETVARIKTVRRIYLVIMIVSATLIIVALGSLVKMLHLKITDVVLAVMKFETNVMILTMIGSDLVVTNLDRARSYTAGVDHVEEQAELRIAAFVGLDAPPVPPPRQ
jgi:hypothetical protein